MTKNTKRSHRSGTYSKTLLPAVNYFDGEWTLAIHRQGKLILYLKTRQKTIPHNTNTVLILRATNFVEFKCLNFNEQLRTRMS